MTEHEFEPPENWAFTASSLEGFGMDFWVKMCRGYFDLVRPLPVVRFPTEFGEASGIGKFTFATFSDELLKVFMEDLPAIEKGFDVMLRFGFRGFSRGGKNGVFYQHTKDKKMLRRTTALMARYAADIHRDLEVDSGSVPSLKKVKVVWHNPSGERIVGVMNEANHRIFFLGFASY